MSVWLAAIFVATGADAQTPGDSIEEVIVTGTIIEVPRRQIATAVSVISGEEMRLRGYNALPDIMRTQPAIGVSNAGGLGKATVLRIRGEEGYRTLLMIDGVKAIDPSATQALPVFDTLLTTSDLDRIEVLRGPQGFIYGADAGGVVNMLTRIGQGPASGHFGLEGGEFGTRKLDASVAGGAAGVDYFVSVTDLETDGFNARLSDTLLMDDDGSDNTTLHAKVGWDVTDGFRLQFVARDIDAATFSDGCFNPVSFAIVQDCFDTTEQTTYKLSATQENARFSNRFGYSEVDVDRDSFAAGVSSFSSVGKLSRLEYTGSFQSNERTTLVYGLDLQNEDVFASGTRDERDQDGYYFEYQGNFADRVYLTLGARYDDNEDFGSATSARVSVAWVQDLDSGRRIKYRGSFGTGFRPPSIFEIAYNAGPAAFPPAANVMLVEEESEGYDLGIEYDAASGLHFEITYFDQEIDNTIEFDLVGFSGYLQRRGLSTSKGLEVAATIALSDRVELLVNVTDNDTEDPDGNPRLRRPELLANLGISYSSADRATRFIANLRASRDAVDIGFAPLDDYEVLDLSAVHRINDRFEIHARIENALDEKYSEILDFYTAGRAIYAGARLQF